MKNISIIHGTIIVILMWLLATMFHVRLGTCTMLCDLLPIIEYRLLIGFGGF